MDSTLFNSLAEAGKMNPPLFVKYEAAGQKCLYDCETGQMFSVNDGVWAIVDDYRRLPLDEIIAKHSDLSESVVRDAFAELEEGRIKEQILIDHLPVNATPIGGIAFNKERFTLERFLSTFSSMIILCITERCNLRCDYCCYSGQFEGQRAHGIRTMSFETARKAVDAHLASRQKNGIAAVSFYGGEPLLEFSLIKEIVHYAKEQAQKRSKKLVFSITTNGTLLDDEKIHFLVENNFSVLVSLDGPQSLHDRYRVFAGNKREGSFETVMKNLKRFVELYPNYLQRGLSITLAPPLKWEETDKLVRELYHKYPLSRVGLVNPGPEAMINGCPASCECDSKGIASTDSQKAYLCFSESDRQKIGEQFQLFVRELEKTLLEELCVQMPLAALLFGPQLNSIHERLVTSKPLSLHFITPCLPGYSRRYCDINGNYHLCERVDDSKRFIIGNVDEGLDIVKIKDLIDWYNRIVRCGDCIAIKNCELCFAVMTQADESEETVSEHLHKICQRNRNGLPVLLSRYTETMMHNRNAFASSAYVPEEANLPLTFIPLTEFQKRKEENTK